MHTEKLKGARCMVTGGAGFIGSHLVAALLHEGASVTVIDNLAAGSRERIPETVAFHNVDIQDEYTLAKLFDGITYVFHLAAIPGVPVSIEDPAYTHRVNVDGTFTVLETARKAKVQRIVFSSSAAVYGEQDKAVLQENMEPKPLSPYALHKITGEYMMQTWATVYGIETVSLRYFNVYGPHMDPTGPYAAVIGKFLDCRAKGELLPITGDGEHTRDFVHVSDVVGANIRAATHDTVGKGEACNIATGVGTSINDVARLIGGDVRCVEPRLEIKHAVADIEKARSLLGYEPSVTLKDGLKKLI